MKNGTVAGLASQTVKNALLFFASLCAFFYPLPVLLRTCGILPSSILFNLASDLSIQSFKTLTHINIFLLTTCPCILIPRPSLVCMQLAWLMYPRRGLHLDWTHKALEVVLSLKHFDETKPKKLSWLPVLANIGVSSSPSTLRLTQSDTFQSGELLIFISPFYLG